VTAAPVGSVAAVVMSAGNDSTGAVVSPVEVEVGAQAAATNITDNPATHNT